MQSSNRYGTLYIVATPIGNKEDITLRALRVLREVNLIAAEDTRHSKLLLQHFNIVTPTISLHEFNQTKRAPLLVERLLQGDSIALISDAGTPLISDPGYDLLQAVQAAGINISPIPGACAAITALCASGLSTQQFIFQGFLPSKASERQQLLQQLQCETRTVIFYEAPHRIIDCVQDMCAILGAEREVVLAKELTKLFETFFRGSLKQASEWLTSDANHHKGEFVVLLQGASPSQDSNEIAPETLRILNLLRQQLSAKQAVELTAQITGEKKNRLKSVSFG